MVGLPYVTVVLKVSMEFKQKDGAELHTKAVLEETCRWETFLEASFMMGIKSKPTRVSAFWWTVFGPQKDSTSNTYNFPYQCGSEIHIDNSPLDNSPHLTDVALKWWLSDFAQSYKSYPFPQRCGCKVSGSPERSKWHSSRPWRVFP